MRKKYTLPKSETNDIKQFVLKNVQNIPVNNSKLNGSYSIKNIKFYRPDVLVGYNDIVNPDFRVEVDIEFKGMIYCRLGKKLGYYDLETYYSSRKITINKMIRRGIGLEIKHRLAYFSLQFFEGFGEGIKKVNYTL